MRKSDRVRGSPREMDDREGGEEGVTKRRMPLEEEERRPRTRR
jgi:hypothetical protein